MATSVGGAVGGGSAGVKGRNVDLEINLTGNLRKYIDQLSSSLDKLKKQSGNFSTTASKSFKDIDNSMKGAVASTDKFDTTASRAAKNYVSNFSKAHGITDKLYSKLTSFRGLSILGVGFGIKSLIGNAKELRQEFLALRGQFAGLSDAQGSASAAMKVYYGAWSQTGASFEQVTSAMQTLGEKGLSPVDEKTKGVSKEFQSLTALSAQLGQATGVSTDAWASLNGQLAFSNKAKVADIRQINSALIATNMTGGQLTTVMNFVNESMDKYGAFAKDGTRSTIALTKGIAGTAAVMNKLGINAQKATEFMGGLMDPEKFGENQALLSQLGVSYKDYVEMLENGSGKETFFDKVMTKLPEFSAKIAAIRDPFARMNLAKSLGLPVEIMQKMANASPGQITAMMKEYQVRAKDEEALKEKQQKMAENSAKLDERFKMIRMKLYTALLPILERNMGSFLSTLSLAATRGGKLFEWIALRFEVFYKNAMPFFNALLSGNFSAIPDTITKGMGNVTKDLMTQMSTTILPALGTLVGTILPKIMAGFLNGFWNTFKALPWWAEMFVGMKLVSGAMAGIGALTSGLMGMVNFARMATGFFTNTAKGSPVEMAQLTQLEQIKLLLAKQQGVAGAADKLGAGDLMGDAAGKGKGGKWGARFGKAGKFLARNGGKILGGAGALVTAGFAASDVMDTNKEAAAGRITEKEQYKKNGSTLGKAGGALGGAAIGAAIGSVVPILGTLVGGLIGGVIGGLGGRLGGPIGEVIAKQIHAQKAGIFQNSEMSSRVSNGQITGAMNAGGGSRTVTNENREQANATMARDKENLGKIVMQKGSGGLDREYTSYMLNVQTGVYEAQKVNARKYLKEMTQLEQDELEKQAKIVEARQASGIKLSADDMEILNRKKDIGNRETEYEYQQLELKKLSGEKLNEQETTRLESLKSIHQTNMNQWETGVKNGMSKISAGFKVSFDDLSSSVQKDLGGAMAMAAKTFAGGAAAMIAGFGAAEHAIEGFKSDLNLKEKFLSVFGMSGAAEATGTASLISGRIREARLGHLATAVEKEKTEAGRLNAQIRSAKGFDAASSFQSQLNAMDANTKRNFENFISNGPEGAKLKEDIIKSLDQSNKEQIQRWEEQLKLQKLSNSISTGSLKELEKLNKKEEKPNDDAWSAFMKNSSMFGTSMLG